MLMAAEEGNHHPAEIYWPLLSVWRSAHSKKRGKIASISSTTRCKMADHGHAKNIKQEVASQGEMAGEKEEDTPKAKEKGDTTPKVERQAKLKRHEKRERRTGGKTQYKDIRI